MKQGNQLRTRIGMGGGQRGKMFCRVKVKAETNDVAVCRLHPFASQPDHDQH